MATSYRAAMLNVLKRTESWTPHPRIEAGIVALMVLGSAVLLAIGGVSAFQDWNQVAMITFGALYVLGHVGRIQTPDDTAEQAV